MRKPKTLLATLTVLGLVFFVAGKASAVMINLDPATQDIAPGDSATVDVVVSDLTAGGPPSLGAFDLSITFDAIILTLDSVVFAGDLGDPDVVSYVNVGGTLVPDTFGLFEAITGASFIVPGVNVFEVSLLTVADLDLIQADTFVLATLSFTGNAVGSSALGVNNVVLSDAFGNSIPDVSVQGATIRVASAAVPEPATLLLLGLGLVALAVRRQRKPSHIRYK